MSKAKIPLHPKHPERTCWGCDKYCSADDLRCGNGTIRTQHPVELFGDDWTEWELGSHSPENSPASENRVCAEAHGVVSADFPDKGEI